jgi:chromosome segregation protein
MLIQEVILENFMSYEYARVPFRPGINVVVGPNGSGKSSLLLAISVALGQTYTERSRKLSDLIRWGRDQARVTLALSNVNRGPNRPVPRYNKDQIFLTRVIRKDGKYWFELENRAASKIEVERLLAKMGVDPNNILIIMHQNMVEQFTVLPQQEKLRMVEAAVGLEPYRENILQAQRKLTRILSQEESVSKLLENAEQTLNYWREQYDRYQEKKQLLTKKRFLERELAWAEVMHREEIVRSLELDKKRRDETLAQISKEFETVNSDLMACNGEMAKLREEEEAVFDARLTLEREKARTESTISFCQQLLRETTLIQDAFDTDKASASREFKLLKIENLERLMATSDEQLSKLDTEIRSNMQKAQSVDESFDKASNQMLETRVRLALLQYRIENLTAELKEIDGELKKARAHVDEAVAKAEQAGPRIAVVKSTGEILDEMRVTEGHLAALSEVSEDIERMYESYSHLYLELKQKAQLVAENREKTLEEVKTRKQAWQTVIQSLLERASLQYQKILIQTQAEGEVRLTNAQDIEAAGLEILVGFKGGKPVPLDAYTQSGGERTTATMSFLLALQQHVRSPFRAVDEYDVHMDPKNRELIAKMLISMVKGSEAQYIVITPSQITFAEENMNIITVQNVEGKSIVREVTA